VPSRVATPACRLLPTCLVKRSTPIWLGLIVSFAVLGGLGYVFRNSLATRVFALAVDQSDDVSCSHAAIQIAKSLDAVEIAPVDCSFSSGPLASAETFATTRIAFKGFGVGQIHVTRAAMNFHKRDVSDIPSNTLEDMANITGMRDQLMKAVLDASEMYSPNVPPVSIDHLTVLREHKRESVIHDFVMTQDGVWNRSRGAKVDVGIEGLAALRNFDRRVTDTRGKLTLDLYLGDADPGEKPDTQLQLDGRNLNRPNRRFELSLHKKDDSPPRRKSQTSSL
jgi:hypothetical protein